MYLNDEREIENIVWRHFPEWAKDDKDIMSMCCAKEAECIIHASDLLTANKEFILQLPVANPANAETLCSLGGKHGYGEYNRMTGSFRAGGHVFEDPDVVAAAVVVDTPGQQLVKAAEEGDAAALQSLLDGGADPNSRDQRSTEIFGCTALMLASNKGHIEACKVLMDTPNIELNAKHPSGMTAIDGAVCWP